MIRVENFSSWWTRFTNKNILRAEQIKKNNRRPRNLSRFLHTIKTKNKLYSKTIVM